ncbi:MAG: YciK family oxidoreductase [Halieaceae bacterium]|nr:YciK family oxidoreductase [Halieaceae bacterium]
MSREQDRKVAAAVPADYETGPDALAGKTVLVTGASAGIGAAAAQSYAAHGATVILVARSVERLEQVYDAIEKGGGPQPAAIPFDLAQDTEEAFIELANAIGAEFPRLDGLLLNASVLGQRRPLEQTTWASWREVMQVNVNSQFLTIKALMPLLQEAGRASLVLTTSGVGREGRAFWGAYSVSKFATEAMMQILASETENMGGLRVNCINPGATNTAMRRAAYPAENPSDNPDPADIMRSYRYLMDDASIGVTGYSFDAQR